MNKKYHLSIIVTNQCNLNCVYCYEHSKFPKSIGIEKAKEIISYYLNSNYEEVEIDFFGGEPFLEFNKIKDICEWTWLKKWKAKYIFFATTNGTLIHGEIAQWLRENKKRFYVSLSIDGLPYWHNRNRSNSFDKIDVNFFKECWPEQTVKMTISKESVGTLSKNIIYIHSLGFKITGTNFAEGIDWENDKFVDVVFRELETLCKYYIDNLDIVPAPLLNMRIYKCEEQKIRNKWCGCGEYSCAYDTDGEKYPCTFFTPMTFSKQQLNEIKNIDFSNPENFIDNDCYNNCYLMPVCNCCYGANYLSTNDVKKRDKSKCQLTKLRAIFSAALIAHKMISNPQNTYENALNISAIKKINELYNKD